jgi:hypothetical protein
MREEHKELPRTFRIWSIYAFALESIIVILLFLFMVFFLRWEINITMMYALLLIMAVIAVILLITGRNAAAR